MTLDYWQPCPNNSSHEVVWEDQHEVTERLQLRVEEAPGFTARARVEIYGTPRCTVCGRLREQIMNPQPRPND
ncbi:hypothetical protein ACFU9Y_03920 [Streptomyces sp. NPDC057621]|uniref:hypothetical protein n=1 Tax=Streptomyces sp. NPDC057621 TaxID=3346186 RepID=UPI0036A7966D